MYIVVFSTAFQTKISYNLIICKHNNPTYQKHVHDIDKPHKPYM